jgi:hypothetical protein
VGKKPKSLVRRLSKWGKRWSGLFGIVMAAAAICVGCYQAWLAHETTKMSVRPHIRVAAYFEGPGKRTGLYLTNLGLGPATLTKLTLGMNGQTFDLMQPHGQEVAVKTMGLDSFCVAIIAPEPGVVIKANEEAPLVSSTTSPMVPLCSLQLMKAISKQDIKVQAEYSSMWDEKLQSTQNIDLDLTKTIEPVQNFIQAALAAQVPAPTGNPPKHGRPSPALIPQAAK